MLPSNETFITLDFTDRSATISDGVRVHRFAYFMDGPGTDGTLRVARVQSDSGAWDISYEIETGRVIDIADAAHAELVCEVYEEEEVQDG